MFTATAIENPVEYYQVSGSVQTNNLPLANVTLKGFPENMLTNENGQFSITLSKNWQGTIIPQAMGYTFSPASIFISPLNADVTSINFIASLITDIDEEEVSSIVAFPNPSTNGRFKLSIPQSVRVEQISIMDSKGSIIHAALPSVINDYQLNEPGLYFIRVATNDSVQILKLLVGQ